MKVPTPRHRRSTMPSLSLPRESLPFPAPTTPTAPTATNVSPPPEFPASEPAAAVPIVYETLRQDATGGILQEEYLLPNMQHAPEPVDLTEMLVDQQTNAVALSSGATDQSEFESELVHVASSQQVGVVRTPCRPPCDVYYVDTSLNSTASSTSAPQSSNQLQLYANMSGGCDREGCLPTSATTEQLDSAADAAAVVTSATAVTSSTAAGTTITSSGIFRQPFVSPSLINVAGPSPCGSMSFTRHLPSYEESMSSDAASVSLSPLTSPLPADEANSEASPSASSLPGYESPPSYLSDRLLELNANTPLKSRQVQQLQEEMSNNAGIRVQLDKTQCAQALALIDCFDRVW